MKTIITLFFFLFFPFLLFAQTKNEYRKYTRYYFKHIEWNGQQYDNSLKGIRLIMEDLENVDLGLHEILKADLRSFKRKRRNGALLIGTGLVVSGGFMMGAVVESLSHGDGVAASKNRISAYSLASLFSLTLGAGLGAGMRPNSRKFIYDFTQKIKENTQGGKLKFTVSPAIGLGDNSSIGLSFALNF